MKFHITPSGKKLVTLIPGDGIGPECIRAAQRIIDATSARIEWEEREAGEATFRKGLASGVPHETIESIRKTGVVFKGPLITPVGGGEKSATITLRKFCETYASIRPVRELPKVVTPYSGRNIDLTVIRENVEELIAGIEHMQSPESAQCLKIVTRRGCEKIVRLSFEYALARGFPRVHCTTKSNIMKLTEGMLKRTFEEVAADYPEIEAQHMIVDNCAHQLVKRPEQFHVLVTTNLNGDILSDLTSGLIGGLGFAPSYNVGNNIGIFEAVHGAAPKYGGKNVINPTAVILSSVFMLRYLGETDAANTIENAVLVTLEEGKVQTGDVVGYHRSANTTTYTDEIIRNLGRSSASWMVSEYNLNRLFHLSIKETNLPEYRRRVIGMDVFIESKMPAEQLGNELEKITVDSPLRLKMIANRGTKIYPGNGNFADCSDQHHCRFLQRDSDREITDDYLFHLLRCISAKYRWVHVEKLHEINGEPGFTKSHCED